MNKDNNMQNPKSRPQISQEVIKGFTAIVDAQDEKGFAKYGRSIDDANDADYDWKLMALEECADHAKYLVREIKRLEAENERLRSELDKANRQAKKMTSLYKIFKGKYEWALERIGKLTEEK